MKRIWFFFGPRELAPAVAAAVLFCGLPAGAQEQQASERPFAFGVGLGAAAKPGGAVGSVGLGTLELGTPWRNLDVRFDVAVMSWKGISGGRVTSLTGNLVYAHRLGIFTPYLVGGVGGYAQQGAGMSFGVNGGVGTRLSLGRLQPFIELREHVWSADMTHRATPLTIGLRF
jgi:hypothetical protein